MIVCQNNDQAIISNKKTRRKLKFNTKISPGKLKTRYEHDIAENFDGIIHFEPEQSRSAAQDQMI